MNAELLLEHFDRMSEAPNAVLRMKKFILEIAMRGKLVDQDPSDTISSVRIGKVPIVEAHEVPFEIPKAWRWVRLGHFADWGSGSTPARGNLDFYGGGILWLKSGELNDDQHLAGSEETVTPLALEKCSFRENRPGDVLLAMYGATLGKVAILAKQAVTNQAVCGCTPRPGVFNRFLFYLLLSNRNRFRAASEGGAQPNISKIKIVNFPVPLPPIAEQHRIVKKIDELMALCDRLQAAQAERERRRDRLAAASLHRLNQPADPADPELFRAHASFYINHLPRLTTRPDQIKQLRQTILNLAVRGRLVEQIESAHRDVLFRNRRSTSDEPFQIPNAWQWHSIDEISDIVTDGEHLTPPRIPDGPIPLVTAKNVRDGEMDYASTDWVSLETAEKAWRRCKPSSGDILLVCVGATTGRLCILDEAKDMVLVRSVAVIRPSNGINVQYLALAIRSPYCQTQIWKSVKATAQPCLYINQTKSLKISVPPIEEQSRIVAKVKELMALCDALAESGTVHVGHRKQLLESVFHLTLAT